MLEPLHHLQHEIAEALRATGGWSMATLFGLSIVFGALHSLLPGHGKTVLAAHHATAGRTGLRWPRAGVDAAFISFARVVAAALVVLGAAQAARLYAGEETIHGHGGAAQVVAGIVFIALGVWLFLTARDHARSHERLKGDVAHRLPLLAMGAVPDPVATVVITYAAVANAPLAGLVAAAGIALGMAATLLAFALLGPALADRLQRGMDDETRQRTQLWVRASAGLVVVAVGIWLLLSA